LSAGPVVDVPEGTVKSIANDGDEDLTCSPGTVRTFVPCGDRLQFPVIRSP